MAGLAGNALDTGLNRVERPNRTFRRLRTMPGCDLGPRL